MATVAAASCTQRAIANPDDFFRLRDGAGSATARISNLRLRTDTDTGAMARQAAKLLTDLRPRPAFYVRLLDTSHPDYPAVERFFRNVVEHCRRRARIYSPRDGPGKTRKRRSSTSKSLKPYTGPVLSLSI